MADFDLNAFADFSSPESFAAAGSPSYTPPSSGLDNILSQWAQGQGGGAFPSSTPSLDAWAGGGAGSATPTGSNWWADLTGGLNKFLGNAGSFAKTIGPIAQLGATGAGIGASIMGMKQAGQNQQLQRQAMNTQRDISRAVLPSATNLTEQGASAMLGGPLAPGIQAEVDAWKQKAQAEINSYLAHAGIQDSTMMAQWQAYIDQQGYLLGQQLSSGLYGQGLQGLGVAGQGASALASTATNMNAGVPSSIADANKALAQLTAQV